MEISIIEKPVPLTQDERNRLGQLETSLYMNLNNAAAALLEIQDKKLFRESHDSFEAYVKDQFGRSSQWANKLIKQGQVNRILADAGKDVQLNGVQANELTMLMPDEQVQVVEHALAEGKPLTAKTLAASRDHILGGAPPPHLQSKRPSKPNSWITPACIVRATKAVMGTIDLDPASDTQANETVGAKRFFTAREDGLEQPWIGSVFLHAPPSRWDAFSDKLLEEMNVGNCEEAIILCPASTSEVWWQRLRWEASIWYSEPRIAMISSNTGKPSHNPMNDFCVMYLGHKHERFLEVFQEPIKSGGRVYCGIVASPVAI
tara:strand:- start:8 stop:961 length:954 start_codon:yes stop_codon:yes gene_type:complete